MSVTTPLPEHWESKVGRCKEDDRGRLHRCPECEADNPGWIIYLRFDHAFWTAFHGVLRYFRCPECRHRFVLRQWFGSTPEIMFD